jgi:hypothetical protein
VKPKNVETEGGKVKVTMVCPLCKHDNIITVNSLQYDLWKNGYLIQHAFPDLSADDREVLKTGYHNECFIKAMGPED